MSRPVLRSAAELALAFGVLGYVFAFAMVGWRTPLTSPGRFGFELGLLAQYLSIAWVAVSVLALVAAALGAMRRKRLEPATLVATTVATVVWALAFFPTQLLWTYRNRPLMSAGLGFVLGSVAIVVGALLPAMVARGVVARAARSGGRDSAWRAFGLALLLVATSGVGVGRAYFHLAPPHRAVAANRPPIDRVLMVGLDGSTWRLASPMIERGELPHLARLAREGTSGTLTSIEPIESPRVWTTVATGKRPEKHGIEDFISDSRYIRTSTLWEILSASGKRVGLYDYLVTHPPPRIDGFVIPGWDGAGRAENLPPGLRKELDVVRGLRNPLRTARILLQRYPVLLSSRTSSAEKMVARTYQDTEVKQLDLPFLIGSYAPDVLATLFFGTDTLGHVLWQYMDPEGFPDESEEDRRRFGPMIQEAYRMGDRAVGSLLEYTDDHTLVLVLSDHGFRRADQLMRLNYPNEAPLLEGLGLSSSVTIMGRGPNFLAVTPKSVDPAVAGGTQAAGSSQALKAAMRAFESVTLVDSGERVFDVDEVAGERPYARIRVRPELDLGRPSSVRAGESLLKLSDLFLPVTLSGTHALDGILIARGPGIRADAHIDGASVLDVTPTILYALGLPVGRDMDGHVLTGLFEDSWLRDRPVTFVDSYDTGTVHQAPADRPEPTPEVLERLKALGYLK